MSFFKLVAAILVVFLFLALVAPSKSAVESCTVTVGPTSMNPNSAGPLFFTIGNTSSVNVVWIKITSPNSNFTVSGGDKSGWSVSTTSSTATFTGGTQGSGVTEPDYIVNVSAGAETASAVWTVQTSDASDGSGAMTCTGSSSVAIASGSEAITSPDIESVAATTTSTTATLTFTTAQPATTVVNYGLATSYGKSQTQNTLATSHTITISSLTSSSTYHYYIIAINASGITFSSEDLTFTTLAPGSQSSQTTTTSTSGSTSSPVIVRDTTPPVVVLKTKIDKSFEKSPLLTASASDEVGVASADYSIDGGGWTPVAIKSGAKIVNFSFTPPLIDDGDYILRIRAFDSEGNEGQSKSYTIVLDRLPPEIGAVLTSVGPMIVPVSGEDIITILPGIPLRITLSAVGGPTSLEVKYGENTSPLVKDSDSGLWRGDVKFPKSGKYTLEILGIDGAKNELKRNIFKAEVLKSGMVESESVALGGVEINVFYFEPSLEQFLAWDGRSYSQENPVFTDGNGEYSLILPKGRYYLEITKDGMKRIKTNIFELPGISVIDSSFQMQRASLVPFANQVSAFVALRPEKEETVSEFVNTRFPEVPGAEDKKLVTFISSWHPDSSQHLTNLEKLSQKTLVVMTLENNKKAEVYKKRGKYLFDFIGDKDGVLGRNLEIITLPTSFQLNDEGDILKVEKGVIR